MPPGNILIESQNTVIQNNFDGCNSWQEIIINNCAAPLCEEDTIQSNTIVNVGEIVEYNATTRIRLVSDFHVDQRALFKAYICE